MTIDKTNTTLMFTIPEYENNLAEAKEHGKREMWERFHEQCNGYFNWTCFKQPENIKCSYSTCPLVAEKED